MRINDPSVRSALFVFLLSRFLIFFVIFLAANISFEPSVPGPAGELHNSTISLRNQGVAQVMRRVALVADSLWMINIAQDGYEKEPFNNTTQRKWAFFPLYPLLLRWSGNLTGEHSITGIVLSDAFFFFALLLLYRTAIAFGYDASIADRALFYLAFFPVSYFFSLPQTESLFLLLTIASLHAAKQQQWLFAGLCGGLASATRFAGVFLFLPLVILYWQAYRANSELTSKSRLEIASDLIGIILVPLGLIGFMIYLKSITGDALAFAHIQVAWGHSAGMFWRPLLTYLRDPFWVSAGWDFRILNFLAAMTALVCSVVLLKRRQWALGVYSLVSITIPMFYQPLLQSLARYTIVIFPVFFVLATVGRRPRLDQFLRAVFVGLLCLMSAMLASGVTLAFA